MIPRVKRWRVRCSRRDGAQHVEVVEAPTVFLARLCASPVARLGRWDRVTVSVIRD